MNTFKYFLWGMIVSFLFLTWLPQFRYTQFYTISNTSYLPKQASDFHALVVAAAEWKSGRSPRFYSEQTLHLENDLQSISKTYQAYGPLSTLMVLPLTNISFEVIRIPLVYLFIFVSAFFLYIIFRKKSDRPLAIGLVMFCLILSAPINYLITRANFELFIAFLLLPLALQVHGKFTKNYITYLTLGLAIHIKPWAVIFTLLALPKKDFKLFLVPLAIAIGLHVILIPWFSITETWLSMQTTAHAAVTELAGFANLTLSSTLQMLNIHIPWQAASLICFASVGIYFLFQFKKKEPNIQSCFAFALCAGILGTAIANLYILITAFFLIWTELKSTQLQKAWFLGLGILVGSNTSLFAWDGPLKSLILIMLMVLLIADEKLDTKLG